MKKDHYSLYADRMLVKLMYWLYLFGTTTLLCLTFCSHKNISVAGYCILTAVYFSATLPFANLGYERHFIKSVLLYFVWPFILTQTLLEFILNLFWRKSTLFT